MKKAHNLKYKITVFLTIFFIIIISLIIYSFNLEMRKIVLKTTSEQINTNLKFQSDQLFGDIEENADLLAKVIKNSFEIKQSKNRDYLLKYLNSMEPLVKSIDEKMKWANGVYFEIDEDLTPKDYWYYVWYYKQNNKVTMYPSIYKYEGHSNYDIYYQTALKAKKGVWTDIYIDYSTKTPIIVYAVPIYKDNKLISVATIDISLNGLKEMTNFLKYKYKASNAFLLDKEYKFVATSGVDKSANLINKICTTYKKSFTDLLFNKIENQKNGFVFNNNNGDKDVVFFSRLSNDYIFVISIPNKVIFGGLIQNTIYLIFIIFGIIVSSFLISTLTGNLLAKHFKKLEDKTYLLESLLHSIPDMIYFKDINGAYIGCNDEFTRYVGRSEKEIIGKTVYDLFDKEFADFFREGDEKQLELCETHSVEKWVNYPDGNRVLLDIMKAPLYDKDGVLVGLLGVGRNITKQKQTEEVLVRSEEKYRMLFDSTVDAVMFLDEKGFIDCNPVTLSLFECSTKEEFCSMNPSDLSPEYQPDGTDSLTLSAEKMHIAIETGRAVFDWVHKRCAGGTEFHAEVTLIKIEMNCRQMLMATVRDISARKNAEIKILESEAEKSTILNNVPFIAWLKDENFRYVTINDEFVNMCRISREEVIGKTDYDFLPKDMADENRKNDLMVMESGEQLIFQHTVVEKNGKLWVAEYYIKPIKDKNNKVIGTTGIITDITKQKQAELQIIESESEKNTILNSLSEIIAFIDTDFKFKWVNKLAYESFGLNENEMVGNLCYEIRHKGNKPHSLCPVAKAMQTGLPQQAEVDVYNGRILLVQANPVFDENNKIRGVVETALDITEQKLAAQATDKINTRLVLATSAAGVGIWEYDIVNNILIWDKQMFKLYGLEESNLACAYESWKNGLHPDDLERGDAEIQMAIRGEKDFETEFRICQPDGTIRNIRAMAVVSRDDSGRAIHMIGTNWDITEQKNAENELIKAKEIAENANKAKSAFLSNMSHEIRTPMNGVIGFINLLSDTNIDDEQKDFVDEAKKSSELLLSLINDILDFSKIEAGKMTMENIVFDIRSNIEDAAVLSTSEAHKKGLEVNALIHSDVPQKLCGDPGRLKQVLNNLINNSVKYTKQGEILITVKLESQTETADILRFEVSDTGIGISIDKLELIFESFTQADASTTRKFGGTGLGLTISKKIIEMMNGEISVSSEEGKGSVFSFSAAFDKCLNYETLKPCLKSLNGIKVLVIDDNLTNIKVAKYYLNEIGCKVYDSNLPGNAFSILEAEKNIDIILLDHAMPEMDGIMLASKIKAIDEFKHIPIVLLTSMAQRGDSKKAKDNEFKGYLTKPIRKNDLFECISMALEISSNNDSQDTESFITEHVIKERNFSSKIKILVAEDNAINQKLTVKILNKSDYTCDIASNGAEAVKAYKNKIYDLILMDCQMPILDGYEATREIREIEAVKEINAGGIKHIPIIALTANALEGDFDKCISFGMDDYICKPLDAQKLIETIKKHLKVAQIEKKQILMSSIIDEIVINTGLSNEESQELCDEYIETIPLMIETIIKAIAENDFKNVSSQAHLMKGSSANLRIHNLTKLALELENAVKAEDILLCSKIVENIGNFIELLKNRD